MKETQGTELPKDSEKLGYKFLLDSLRDQLLKENAPEEVLPEVAEPVRETTSSLALPEGKKYFRIGEVAELIGVKPYVLRYWETEFGSIRPRKSRSGQRVYERRDVLLLGQIHFLIHVEKFSLPGAKRKLLEMRRAAKTGESAPKKSRPFCSQVPGSRAPGTH
jgi:hypothetical protein